MKTYNINEQKYELIKDFRDAFDLDEVITKLTDYFTDYDYIIGDWAYGKLRLKGFYDSNSQKVKPLNDFKNSDDYIINYCAKNCRHFILKKIN